jgi:hypothetical protein
MVFCCHSTTAKFLPDTGVVTTGSSAPTRYERDALDHCNSLESSLRSVYNKLEAISTEDAGSVLREADTSLKNISAVVYKKRWHESPAVTKRREELRALIGETNRRICILSVLFPLEQSRGPIPYDTGKFTFSSAPY